MECQWKQCRLPATKFVTLSAQNGHVWKIWVCDKHHGQEELHEWWMKSKFTIFY